MLMHASHPTVNAGVTLRFLLPSEAFHAGLQGGFQIPFISVSHQIYALAGMGKPVLFLFHVTN